MKTLIISIVTLGVLLGGTQCIADSVSKDSTLQLDEHLVKSYTSFLNLGHTYKVGDHVVAKENFFWSDATILSLTSRGRASVIFSNGKYYDDYDQVVSKSLEPWEPVQEYTSGLFFQHTYRVGDHVFLKISSSGGLLYRTSKVVPVIIEELTAGGLTRLHFDGLYDPSYPVGHIQDISELEPEDSTI